MSSFRSHLSALILMVILVGVVACTAADRAVAVHDRVGAEPLPHCRDRWDLSSRLRDGDQGGFPRGDAPNELLTQDAVLGAVLHAGSRVGLHLRVEISDLPILSLQEIERGSITLLALRLSCH